MSRDLVNIPPALEQRATDALHACVRAMIGVADVAHHLFGSAPVAWREGLIPGSEEELVRLRARVLRITVVRVWHV